MVVHRFLVRTAIFAYFPHVGPKHNSSILVVIHPLISHFWLVLHLHLWSWYRLYRSRYYIIYILYNTCSNIPYYTIPGSSKKPSSYMLSHHTWSPRAPLINVVAPCMPASEPKSKQSDVTTLNWGEGGMLVSSQWVWLAVFFEEPGIIPYCAALCHINIPTYTNHIIPHYTTYTYIYI